VSASGTGPDPGRHELEAALAALRSELDGLQADAAASRRGLERELDRTRARARRLEQDLRGATATVARLRRRRVVRLADAARRTAAAPSRAVAAAAAAVRRLAGRTAARVGLGRSSGGDRERRRRRDDELVALIRDSLPEAPAASGRVTVLVEAHRDAAQLQRCLIGLQETDWSDLEVFVLGPEADRALRAATGSQEWSTAGHHRIRPVGGESHAEAREDALAIATGDMVLLLHDGVRALEPTWLRRMVAALEEWPAGAVGARLLLPALASRRGHAPRSLTVAHLGLEFRSVDGIPRPHPIGFGSDPLDPTGPARLERPAASEACLLVARATLDEVGPPRDDPGDGPAVGLCLQIRALGRPIVVEGSAVLFQHDAIGEPAGDPGPGPVVGSWLDRWAPRIMRSVLLDRLHGRGKWSQQPLRVGIALGGGAVTAGNPAGTVADLGRGLERLGWTVRYLRGDAEGWAAAVAECDIVISGSASLDLFRLPPAVVSIALVEDGADAWTSEAWFGNYDIVLAATTTAKDVVEAQSPKTAVLFPADAGSAAGDVAEQLRDIVAAWASATRVAVHIGPQTWEAARSWGDMPFGRDVQRHLERRGFPTALLVHGEADSAAALRADVVLHLLGVRAPRARAGQVTGLWVISHPDRVTESLCESYDVVFSASDLLLRQLDGRLRRPLIPLHQATEPARFYPDPTGPHHQLLFVGNSRRVARPILEALRGTSLDLAVYGGNWTPELLDPEHLKGSWVPNDELRRYYSSADVVLNDHWADMRAFGIISNRVYDALACGAFVVSDRVPGIDEEFDGAVVTYGTPDELHALLSRYLADPAARAEAGARGRAAVLERHTFAQRVDRIVEELMPLALARPRTMDDAPVATADE
jgi:hypothetical protein